jgi:serine/threonine-protein kinase
MSFFTNVRADRLIAEIKSTKDAASPATQKAIAKLKDLGPGAIEPLFAALADADKAATLAYIDVLAALVSPKTFQQYITGLIQGGTRVVAGIAWALTSSRNYPAHLLLDSLATEGVPKAKLLDVINAHKSRYKVGELLNAAYNQEPNEKAALFRIIAEIADDAAVPELLGRLQGKDPVARMHIINILARFNQPPVRAALHGQLKDSSKLIRSAALAALTRGEGPIDVERVAELLRDPEIEVQNRAIDLLIKANDPLTIRHLVPVLKDENEYARRAAVEVLNEIGNEHSVKDLLGAIADDDWWVRSRAADALGKIGGPKVVNAVLALVQDKNKDVRRTAIEILNQTKDERAVDHLIEATRDKDWWVSERAVDALAEIGSKRAVPRLLEMLAQGDAKTFPVLVRALGKLGDAQHIPLITPLLARPEKEIRVDSIQALAKLADGESADAIRAHLEEHAAAPENTVAQAALRAISELDIRFGGPPPEGTLTASARAAASTRGTQLTPPGGTRQAAASVVRPPPAAAARPPPATRPGAPEPLRTMMMSETEVARAVQAGEVATAPKLDISTLKGGDIIEGRYKYIERIGRGAFGTVLLMEDTVVDERLILKFLNPNVSQDEEMMKRFVHELRYSRKITHENVIRIYDFLFIQGNYAISMEYFPSHTLGSEIVGDKPMPLKRAIGFGIDICNGMTVAHKIGIVHRDLKPANVLINEAGLLKVVDFGVAAVQREGETQLTKTGYVIGSPKYMAPEQILGKKVDPRADIYALGVIMYEMLTGVPPYSRGDHMSVMYQHVQGKARAPREVNPALPPELSEVIVQAMAVDKNKRFQSMDELRVALEKYR